MLQQPLAVLREGGGVERLVADVEVEEPLEEQVVAQPLAAAPKRPASDRVVVRKVDRNGSVSFAGANYRVGNAFRGRQVEVSLAGDTVPIWSDDRIIRTHAARHDRRKEHGAFANPGGRPDRINAA